MAENSTIAVVNPLPVMLHHYERELVATLGASGLPGLTRVRCKAAEVAGQGFAARATATVDLMRVPKRVLSTAGRSRHALVVWPAFGLYEPALWHRAARDLSVSIVIHDPTPLRRSLGFSRVAARVGGAAAGRRVHVLVHSTAAADALGQLGWPKPVLLPHPVLGQVAIESVLTGDRNVVLVAGQYKPARDVELLSRLGPPLRQLGYQPVIAGRGWPEISGWSRHRKQVTEDELDALIRSAAVVVIPYRSFFQSGVAVRALEAHRPIAGPHHAFLTSLFGNGWPGLAVSSDTECWVSAVTTSASMPTDVLRGLHASYANVAQTEWSEYFTQDLAGGDD